MVFSGVLLGIVTSYRLRWKRKRWLIRARRKARDLRPVADRTGALGPRSILLFATLRNERPRLPWFLKYIDIQNSPHRKAYEKQLARLKQGGSVSRLKPGPVAVHRVLRHALYSPRPRPHYVMTIPARVGAVLKRILPASLAYRITAGQA